VKTSITFEVGDTTVVFIGAVVPPLIGVAGIDVWPRLMVVVSVLNSPPEEDAAPPPEVMTQLRLILAFDPMTYDAEVGLTTIVAAKDT
jgi:hypothetical protein